MTEKVIEITLIRDLLTISAKSGGGSWFQEEQTPTFYALTDEGAHALGGKIRIAESYSRDFEKLGLKYSRSIITAAGQHFRDTLEEMSVRTGISKTRLHNHDQHLSLWYEDDRILFRYCDRSTREKFGFRYKNGNLEDELSIPRNCSNVELGQLIINWAIDMKA